MAKGDNLFCAFLIFNRPERKHFNCVGKKKKKKKKKKRKKSGQDGGVRIFDPLFLAAGLNSSPP